MGRAGLVILYVVATASAFGGVLGTADVPAVTTSSNVHLLRALGGGLVGIGIAKTWELQA